MSQSKPLVGESVDETRAVVGARVILADATGRSSDVLGTVLEPDPYPDRDVILRVGFENGVAHWLHRNELRRLGDSCCPDALAEWEWKHLGVEAR